MKLPILLFAFLSSLVCLARAKEFHVSPQGDDQNAGAAAAPWRTLEGARDAVRAWRGAQPSHRNEPVTVWLHGGTYGLSRTFELLREDSGTASAPLRLFVLAKVYDIPLSVGTVAIFLVTIILLSFGTVGLPSGLLAIPTLPAYMAAGIPIEGVVILEAVDAIPDVFKTVLNVTADMSAATILSRAERREAEGARADLPRIEDAA